MEITSEMLLKLAAQIEAKEKTSPKIKSASMKRQEKVDAVLEHIRSNGGATIKSIVNAVKVSEASAFLYTKELEKTGKVERVGKYPVRYYLAGTVDKEAIADKKSATVEKVLQYASDNAGKRFSIHQMAKDIGLSQSYVDRVVNELKRRKLLANDFNKGDSSAQRQSAKKSSGKDPFMGQVEMLAFQYLKATKDANLLSFLVWLENK